MGLRGNKILNIKNIPTEALDYRLKSHKVTAINFRISKFKNTIYEKKSKISRKEEEATITINHMNILLI